MKTQRQNFVWLCILTLGSSIAARAQWVQAVPGSSFLGDYALSFAVQGPKVWAGGEAPRVFFSSDNGFNWSLKDDSLPDGPCWTLAVLDSSLFVGTSSGVYRSTNDGATWFSANTGIEHHIGWMLGVRPTNTLLLVTADSGIFRSSDLGATWKAIDSGLGTLGLRSLLVSGPFVYAGGGVTDVFRSSDNGTSWSTFSSGLPQFGLPGGIWALATGGPFLYAGFDNDKIYRSSDEGEHWTWSSSGLTPIHIRGLAAFGSNVVAATLEGGVFLSTDDGTSWAPINDGLPDLGTWSIIVKGSNLFVGTVSSGIWRRPLKDLGITETWKIASLSVKVTDPRTSRVFPEAVSSVFGYNGIAYQSADTVVNGLGYWVKIAGDSLSRPAGASISTDTINVQPGWNLVGSIDTTIGVSSVTSLPGGLITSQFYTYDTGYAAVDSIRPGIGYWVKVNDTGQLIFSASGADASHSRITIVDRHELPPPPPAEEKPRADRVPEEFSLLQNYPNPFNPTTMIRYALPESSRLTLKIFDLLGQSIATLAKGQQEAGYHSVEWNAGNAASGIYFCRMEAVSLDKPARAFVETHKLILMK